MVFPLQALVRMLISLEVPRCVLAKNVNIVAICIYSYSMRLLNEEFLQPEIILEKYNYKEADILQLQVRRAVCSL